MTARDTSILAYVDIQPELSERQKQVYEALKGLGEANNLMIAQTSGLNINVVTPRINEMVKMEVVKSVGKRKCHFTNRLTYWWQIK
jgi:predicted HTH transcriptional regulator